MLANQVQDLRDLVQQLDEADAQRARGGVDDAFDDDIGNVEAVGVVLLGKQGADSDADAGADAGADAAAEPGDVLDDFAELPGADEKRSRRARDVAWFWERRNEPIAPGKPTVLQTAYTYLKIKVSNAMTNKAFDQMVKRMAQDMVQPNLFPGCAL